ncbi:putative cytokinetic ring protein SteA [Aeromicrobium sp. A1-2]|uniref:putative cytokinetic ring protein SteA n=1 Tax=Aeromicrobium sp. A1-2 TaxID=2107713 RepID=UPI000E4E2248|nr:putative cytokinetic ring protein SteA [Aeromicrobium sp. A1-2]
MAIRRRKTPMSPDVSGVVGTVRLARSERKIAALREGDIAIVDLPELDAREAQQLIDQRVRAVINASRSSSGRVPNVGPQMLSRAGILLVDVATEQVWGKLKNGEQVRIEDGRVLRNEIVVVTGTELDEARATSDLAQAESGLATKLDSLAANASDHIQREQSMLLAGANVPRLRTKLRGRAVVVVSRAYDDAADLRGLRRYINDNDPILIGAGPGADVLLKAGYVPAVVVGRLDSLSDAAIRAAGEVVVSTASGAVDRPERLERHGKEIVKFVSTGSDDDLAILLADTNEAAVIVHVGSPPTLSTFLERPPAEVARMFVARLRAGAKIVDAKSVHHFTSQRYSLWPALLLLAAGLVAVAIAVAVTPVGGGWYDSLGGQLADLGTWIKGFFS